jgi:hypothetical protein
MEFSGIIVSHQVSLSQLSDYELPEVIISKWQKLCKAIWQQNIKNKRLNQFKIINKIRKRKLNNFQIIVLFQLF